MSRFIFAVFLALISTATVFAQGDAFGEDPYCNAGVHPDGYIDFSGLPPAPSNANHGPSAAVSATLPVQGVPGLQVTVTIPPLVSYEGGPVYTVTGGTLELHGVISDGTSGVVNLAFNKHIAGLSLVAAATGRFRTGFALSTDASPADFTPFTNTEFNYNFGVFDFGLPLQMLDTYQGLQTASVLFEGGEESYSATLSNFRVQSTLNTKLSPDVPRDGLQQWLRSEGINGIDGSPSGWHDASGNRHDATLSASDSTPYAVQADGQACQPAYSFSNNRYFNFHLPIDGWDQMTVFMVAKSQLDPPSNSYASFAAAMLWTENALWGNTFVTPYQGDVAFRFGTTQVGNQPIFQRPVTVGQDFTLTRAVHNRSVDSLYVNSIEVLRQGDKYPVLSGTTGSGTIGKGLGNTYYNGEISEILVYNRVLSTNEAAKVESYLRNKFGLH